MSTLKKSWFLQTQYGRIAAEFSSLCYMHHILTHPTYCNYGGILQAYALQSAVHKLGVPCNIIDYLPVDWAKWMRLQGPRAKFFYWCTLLRMILGSRKEWLPRYLTPLRHVPFKRCFMRLAPLRSHNIDSSTFSHVTGFIVGSDQVWRGVYAREMHDLPFFFLSFATQEQRKCSFAYAASFGSDAWEGTQEETAECARLLKEFKTISVREHSGIKICREVFGVDAVQMPDPTLLLEQEDYTCLIHRWWTVRLQYPCMAVYLLDETEEKKLLTQAVADQSGLYLQQLTAHGDAPRAMDRIPLSIPQWLRCIRDAECVLTDSFHGCVFAIIFNKPFVCLGNEERGSARFDSLLGAYGLMNRLLTNPSPEQVAECMNTPIDWEQVNHIRSNEKQRAIQFLKENLN